MDLSLDKICVSYDKEDVVDKISLSFLKNDWHFFIGTTGSGKSTLLEAISGLVKISSGEIYLNKKSIKEKSVLKELRNNLGIMFQYTDRQFFNHTVKEEIIFTLKNKKLKLELINKKLEEIVKKLELPPEMLEKSPFELSGGQKRMVALASILINEPKILVLDEPTVGLDVETKELFFKILKQQNDEGVTIIQSCHILEDVAEYAKTVTVLKNGKIQASGLPEEIILSRKILEEANLEPPEILEITESFRAFYEELPNFLKVEKLLNYLEENKNVEKIWS